MSGFVKTAELAEVLKVSRRQLLERARREQWAAVKTGGGVLFVADKLPPTVQIRLAERQIAGRRCGQMTAAVSGTACTRPKDVQTAADRIALIHAYGNSGLSKDEFIRLYNRQETAQAVYAKLGSVSVQTFFRWVKLYKEQGTAGLVPRHSRPRGGAGASMTDEEKQLLKFYWFDSTQPSAMHAYRKMLLNLPESRCTYETAQRYLKSLPKMVSDFYRLGESRWENMYLPYMEQAVQMYGSLDCVVSDHHCLDCVVMYHGRLIRPWLTTFQDYRSGKILGWCPCVTPSSLSIIVAYYMVCYYYGVPPRVLFDNGKDYRSKLLNGWKAKAEVVKAEGLMDEMRTETVEAEFAGIFGSLGSDVHFTRTYNGKSKGRQERYFRIIGEYIAKDIGTYVGSDSRSRPEEAQLLFRALNGKEKRTDVPDWNDYVKLCNTMIPYINDNFVSSGKGIKGMTRSEAFETFKTREFRKVSKEELQKALCKGELRKVTRNGFTVGGIHYWAEELAMYVGQQVIVKTQLVFDNKALAYTVDGRFICECEGNYFMEDRSDTGASIKKLESARQYSFAKAAELGATGEVTLDADARIMHNVAAGIYDQAPRGIDEILGIGLEAEDDEKPAAESECTDEKPAKNAPYKSVLDAGDLDYIDMMNAG